MSSAIIYNYFISPSSAKLIPLSPAGNSFIFTTAAVEESQVSLYDSSLLHE